MFACLGRSQHTCWRLKRRRDPRQAFSIISARVHAVCTIYCFEEARVTMDDSTTERVIRRCPECQQKLKIKKRSLGKPRTCPRCRHRFIVPLDGAAVEFNPGNVVTGSDWQIDEPPPFEHTGPRLDEETPDVSDAPAGTVFEADEADADPFPSHDSSEVATPIRETSTSTISIVQSVPQRALGRSKLVFTVMLFLIWAVGSIAGVAGSLLFPPVMPVVVGLWTFGCGCVYLGTMSYMFVSEISTGSEASVGEAWAFVGRKSPSLLLGPFFIGVCFFGLVALVAGAGFFLSTQVPMAGPIVYLPMFVVLAFATFFLVNFPLLPCIIGVDDGGAIKAAGVLAELVAGKSFFLMGQYVQVAQLVLPTVLFTGVIVGLAGSGAFFICQSGAALSGSPAAMALTGVPVLLVVGGWIAFNAIYVAGSYAVVYLNACNHSA